MRGHFYEKDPLNNASQGKIMVSNLINDKAQNNNERYAQELDIINQDSKYTPRENYGEDLTQIIVSPQESVIHGSES
jgi:hypothetical protein